MEKQQMKTNSIRPLAVTVLAGWATAAILLSACAQKNAEVQLQPETREGLFYLQFAEAREVAQRENKHLLVDFWRPG